MARDYDATYGFVNFYKETARYWYPPSLLISEDGEDIDAVCQIRLAKLKTGSYVVEYCDGEGTQLDKEFLTELEASGCYFTIGKMPKITKEILAKSLGFKYQELNQESWKGAVWQPYKRLR